MKVCCVIFRPRFSNESLREEVFDISVSYLKDCCLIRDLTVDQLIRGDRTLSNKPSDATGLFSGYIELIFQFKHQRIRIHLPSQV